MRLSAPESRLLVIDVQQRLLPVMADSARVVERSRIMLAAAAAMNVPVLATEQYPKGLGPTVPELLEPLGSAPIFEKLHFSAYAEPPVRNMLREDDGRRQIVVLGIEAHVCVLQTVLDLLQHEYRVFVVSDAISSRSRDSVALAEARMRQAGAILVNAEMCVFEWLGQAGHPQFRALSKLIK
ncbi:hydrolase [Ferrovibrio sp.]|uniref:hydrolase n=1 Tax=Ferrovibrio sp. TaxID=1917215 RepID=UPI0025C2D85F|nr:hydrolase [Ferrovibrio sp.]MBX3454987.1 hydrolase [Ferrovibrio sp.]